MGGIFIFELEIFIWLVLWIIGCLHIFLLCAFDCLNLDVYYLVHFFRVGKVGL